MNMLIPLTKETDLFNSAQDNLMGYQAYFTHIVWFFMEIPLRNEQI